MERDFEFSEVFFFGKEVVHDYFHFIVKKPDYKVVLADFEDYVACQDRVNEAYQDSTNWTKMSILNSARVGKFSSDRSIQEYCDEIWKTRPVPVQLADARGDDTNLRLGF